MTPECFCSASTHPARLVVVTGGPGAGKTALLEVVRRHFCKHVAVLPESASILFSGGFPRRPSDTGRQSAQRAIFHVQRELERLASGDGTSAVALCDRGTIDGVAYWPGGDADDFFGQVGTTRAIELARYSAVLHLRSPDESSYNHANPVRIETAREAHAIDERILEAWSGHPNRHVIESTPDFMAKVKAALAVLHTELPECCQPEIATADVGIAEVSP